MGLTSDRVGSVALPHTRRGVLLSPLRRGDDLQVRPAMARHERTAAERLPGSVDAARPETAPQCGGT